jgi:hypothetical protein
MVHLKTHEDIEIELQVAQKAVKIGGVYAHYKNAQQRYKVIALGTQEETDKICVIYQSEYGKKLIFVRDLDNWLDKPKVEGQLVERFKLIE